MLIRLEQRGKDKYHIFVAERGKTIVTTVPLTLEEVEQLVLYGNEVYICTPIKKESEYVGLPS